ncbi:hypothetical protein DOM22_19405 [Bdellovibrio sp. ZAP7]|uniref:hypothetical protein n=1 Tax=Bdellovibrio sp. ZAP7 TaxID=2231053 RepID=UPI00115A6838|nr:hypothetical protein [Bdellovibrio sp. ZAP7]QDK47177.1 hypothetical protein DOM22_19405 [Bdellovibrio sp. ZAP7]
MLHPLSFVKKLSVFLLIYVSSNQAVAQVYNSSASVAAGGTGRAAVEPGDASFLNPASMAHLGGRFLFTSFADKEFAAFLSDNTKESTLPAAAAYVQKSKMTKTLGELNEHDIGITLAEFFKDKWSVGLTGHYLEQTLAQGSYHSVNGDLGLLYTPMSDMGLGLVVYNVFGENNNTAPEELRYKTKVGGGFNYIYKGMFRVRVDGDSEGYAGLGLETFINRFIVFRFGYSDDFDDSRPLVSAGMGFSGPRFRLNYAYFGNTQKSSDYRHSIDLIIPF